MALPSIGMEMGDGSRHRCVLFRCSPFQGSMRAMMVEVCPEIEQLVFEIRSGPEQRAIQKHPAKSDPVDASGMDSEPHDATRVLIHDDQDPVSPQPGRFAPEHI